MTRTKLVPAVVAWLRCAGTQFHPRVVDAFCALIAERESALRAA